MIHASRKGYLAPLLNICVSVFRSLIVSSAQLRQAPYVCRYVGASYGRFLPFPDPCRHVGWRFCCHVVDIGDGRPYVLSVNGNNDGGPPRSKYSIWHTLLGTTLHSTPSPLLASRQTA